MLRDQQNRKGIPRRTWIGGLGAAGLAGLGTVLYQQAPSFWRQFARESLRPVNDPPARPNPRNWPDKGLHAAWLGHSTALIKVDGFTILTDPIFSDRAGIDLMILTLGIKRVVAPALDIESLPRIDLILLSHAHMDHFDTPSLRRLESKGTRVITAWSTSDLLRVNRYKEVRELRWNEAARAGPARIQAFEVKHWGARMRTDTWRGYNGYRIEAGRYRILFAGDTADTDLFRVLKESRRYDLAIMPIGAYNPWIHYHCTPEQAWRMGNEAGAELFMPVHHQTFSLSREPYYEPIERFHAAAGPRGEQVGVSRVGEEVRL